MIEIRRTPLPGRVEWTLDSAADCGEIDSCTASTLRLYGDPDRLSAIVGEPLTPEQVAQRAADFVAGRRPECGRVMIAAGMTAEADGVLDRLDPRRRGALVHDGLRGVRFAVKNMAEFLSDAALTDAVEGGSLERFKRGREVRLDRRGMPHRRTYRRLCSPSFVRRYVRRSGELDPLRASAAALVRRLAEVPPGCVRSDPGVWADMDGQLEAFREHRRREVEADERAFWRERIPAEKPKTPDPGRRRILKRASAVAGSVLGAAAVNALARGDRITVEGPSMALAMRKRGLLSDAGHGCLSVSLLDLAGEPLAELCVYQDSIPAIDQAVGLALMVQSGLEAQLLAEANVTRVMPAGEGNPLVAARCRPAATDRLVVHPTLGARWSWDQHQAWRRTYWIATGAMWTDAIACSILGRNRKMIEGFPT